MSFAPRSLMDELLDGPIVGGMLDDDFYKDTMGQYSHRFWPGVDIVSGMTNRSKMERLAEIIRERDLIDELDAAQARRFTKTDLHYLRGTNEYGERMFAESYLLELEKLVLPKYDLSVKDGQYDLRFKGAWLPTSRWEIPALAIVNELRNRAILKKMFRSERDEVLATGILRLREKIKTIRKYPGLTFTDFGTRRRFARAWQRYVVKTLAEELPGQFLGTSNTEAAKDFGVLPMGTNAHELFMVVAAILSALGDDALHGSHNRVLREWWELYGYGLSIALTDTFGSDFFFRDMTAQQAAEWKGLRHDSGDPMEFAEKAIAFFQKHGLNPLDKLLIFSDGLDMDMIIKLWEQLEGRIKRTFGWGTLLTNDLGIKPISIVIKVIMARIDGGEWIGTVKLSDNEDKHMGTTENISRYRHVFDYTRHFHEECRV